MSAKPKTKPKSKTVSKTKPFVPPTKQYSFADLPPRNDALEKFDNAVRRIDELEKRVEMCINQVRELNKRSTSQMVFGVEKPIVPTTFDFDA